ncbi:MAG: WYL domain-containing protein, partial [Solirubrobacterales bacterium]
IHGWPRTGEVADARLARVWMAPDRARWAREDKRVVSELADGAVIVELPYAGTSWLVREILRGAGDLVVLEPDDAREAIRKEVAA